MLDFEQRIAALCKEIEDFRSMQRSRHNTNFASHWTLVVVVLACSAFTTVASIFRMDQNWIALGGTAATVFITLNTALGLGEKAEFQRIIATEADILLSDLGLSDIKEDSFEKVRAKFNELRRHADAQLPKGGGMEAVRQMTKTVSSHRT